MRQVPERKNKLINHAAFTCITGIVDTCFPTIMLSSLKNHLETNNTVGVETA